MISLYRIEIDSKNKERMCYLCPFCLKYGMRWSGITDPYCKPNNSIGVYYNPCRFCGEEYTLSYEELFLEKISFHHQIIDYLATVIDQPIIAIRNYVKNFSIKI